MYSICCKGKESIFVAMRNKERRRDFKLTGARGWMGVLVTVVTVGVVVITALFSIFFMSLGPRLDFFVKNDLLLLCVPEVRGIY